ncbi:GerMN domain-containing protein [Kocuria rosea]|jgi:hypothetical protein|uniref:GerMN domain-containing protein n=1 Tax=Kocuria rosea TaxID=1275 RepID=UPI00203A5D75|nr:GerMN domain-containing protein [Kocuria rosea]MCM3687422.1 GerMN domain-containing protein [Kocuria rosea]HST73089.1 GerMN domain-containing protein [Kocuria rosea]
MPAPPPRRTGAPRRAAAWAAAAAVALGGCGEAAPPADGTGAAPARSSDRATAGGTAGGSVATTKLPVYWVGGADGEQLLFREFRDPPEGSRAADPIAAAAELMTAAAPEDPDYRSLWNAVDRIGSSTSPDGTITVDLPDDAFRQDLAAEDARLALQQLAHTVAAAARTAGLLPEGSRPQVVLLVDGRPHEEVFGSVRLGEPVRPDEQLEAPVWLVDPQEGTRSDGRLALSGRVLEGVRDCEWTVTAKDDDGTVAGGPVTVVPAQGRPAEFRAEVDLPPGEYVVSVIGRDAEGGPVRDDKDVVVGAP